MPWEYVLRTEERTPPCPYCTNVLSVVRIVRNVYCCQECNVRRGGIFEATWVEEQREALPRRIGRAG